MKTDEYIEQLEELIEKCWNLPLSGGRCLVDGELISDLVEKLKESLPGELMQAKAIVADRNEILQTARREADQMHKNAEERAKALVARDEITKGAELRANEILAEATHKANELIAETNRKEAAALENANAQANELIAKTKQQATALLSQANAEASQTLNAARQESEQLRKSTTAYADNAFYQLMEFMQKTDRELKRAHGEYKSSQLK